MYTIIGYSVNSGVINEGEANERKWTNYDVYCSYTPSFQPKGLFGDTVKTVRVPEKVMERLFDEVGDGNEVIGLHVNFEFDTRMYNGVEKIITTDIIPVDTV